MWMWMWIGWAEGMWGCDDVGMGGCDGLSKRKKKTRERLQKTIMTR